MTSTPKSTNFIALYFLFSLGGFLCQSLTTGLGFLMFVFVFFPLYTISVWYWLHLSSKYAHRTVRAANLFLYSTIFLQTLVYLTNPVDCYGWHQGNTCSSFLRFNLNAYSHYWGSIDDMSLVFILLYFASLGIWLKIAYTIRIARNHRLF
jgi:hypothetical protein